MMTRLEDQIYEVAFAGIESIGPRKIIRLRSCFASLREAWEASESRLLATGLSPKDAHSIIKNRKDIDPVALWGETTQAGISVVTVEQPDYPEILQEIYSPPAVLFYRGKLPDNKKVALAVVGTRKTTAYGRQITPELVNQDPMGEGWIFKMTVTQTAELNELMDLKKYEEYLKGIAGE